MGIRGSAIFLVVIILLATLSTLTLGIFTFRNQRNQSMLISVTLLIHQLLLYLLNQYNMLLSRNHLTKTLRLPSLKRTRSVYCFVAIQDCRVYNMYIVPWFVTNPALSVFRCLSVLVLLSKESFLN